MSDDTKLDHHSRALEFALGRLTESAESDFIRDMESNPELRAEYDHVMNGISDIAEGFAEAMPAPRRALKSRVLEYALGKEAVEAEGAPHVVRAEGSEWQESGLPGITMKVLYEDKASQRQTVLVRIAAGVQYPRHRHVGTEECLVLEGDLNLDGIKLTAGDFVVNADGDVHDRTWSDNGCVLLLSGSLHDDFSV
ncbi:MAG TPA: cupin domain-containing protein [Candidatus Kapabacteria bacterium]|nr:cupin domain-containing protein [Candidatus Kapabacteria bacterium]